MKSWRLMVLVAGMLITGVSAAYSKGCTIVDATTGMPLPKASIFDRKGNIVGICSDDGKMPYVSSRSYPLTVRYMGYATATIDKPVDGDILLQSMAYDLPEMTVNSKDHQVLHILGYVREYSTLSTYSDTVMLFREKTVDFMLPTKKVKNYRGWSLPRVLASRSFYHLTNAEGLDSVSNHFNEHFSWSDWIGVCNNVYLPPALREDSVATYVSYGKYSPSTVWRRFGGNINLDIDVLANSQENRKWVPQFSEFVFNKVDCNRLTLKYIFSGVDSHEILADNISGMSFNIETNGRRRNLKWTLRTSDPIYVTTYAELYITDREYMSVSNAYKWEKKPPLAEEIGIVPPADAPELQPAIAELIGRVESFDYDTPRLDKQPDRRLGTPSKFATDKPDGFFKRLLKIMKH